MFSSLAAERGATFISENQAAQAPTNQYVLMGISRRPKQALRGQTCTSICCNVVGSKGTMEGTGMVECVGKKGNNSGGLERCTFVNGMKIFHYFQNLFCS